MAEHRGKGGGPPRTRSIEFGAELPRPNVDGLFSKSDPLPPGQVAELHFEAGPKAPAVVTLAKSVTVLGRGEGIADVDVGDESASRRHATIVFRQGRFKLNDMGSTNGTFLNGELVGETELKSGDQIQIGTAVMRFELAKK
jgi:predicted component of type VI protein secretion system